MAITKTTTKPKAKVVKAKVIKKTAPIKVKVATTTVTTVRKQLQTIGDLTATLYNQTGDLKAAQTALQAYNGAISASKAQLIYKKLAGKPAKIAFFED